MNFLKIPGKDFEMMDAPLTQADWVAIEKTNPARFKEHAENPVECVSYDDVMRFIEKLNSKKDGFSYRLPTEGEWEYCCRAGSKDNYCFGNYVGLLTEYAWFLNNSNNQTHPVKQKKPNAWGLYDMHGNVWEWTESMCEEAGSDRVIRGGGWYNGAQDLRSAIRVGGDSDVRDYGLGARLVRTACSTMHSITLPQDDRVTRALAAATEALESIKKILEAIE